MSKQDIFGILGISAYRKVGSNFIIEFPAGGARPASALEIRALNFLLDRAAISQ